jgi:membrane-bound lytic murein transglycosylase MltF
MDVGIVRLCTPGTFVLSFLVNLGLNWLLGPVTMNDCRLDAETAPLNPSRWLSMCIELAEERKSFFLNEDSTRAPRTERQLYFRNINERL